jgi:hypothetical protein
MYITTIYGILFAVIIAATLSFAPHGQTPDCLMANQVDPESGYHLTVHIEDDTPNWYVTGPAWDHTQHE